MSAIKELAAEVLLQAAKDYFFGEKYNANDEDRQKTILKELHSDWLVFLTDGMSVVVAEQIELRPDEIRFRLRKEENTDAENLSA